MLRGMPLELLLSVAAIALGVAVALEARRHRQVARDLADVATALECAPHASTMVTRIEQLRSRLAHLTTDAQAHARDLEALADVLPIGAVRIATDGRVEAATVS